MEILLNSSNEIYTVSLDVVSKVLVLSGNNNYPMDVNSIRSIYNTTHAGNISLPNKLQFVWFRVNGLPVYIWGISNLPTGSANADVLNLLVDIPLNQSQFSLQEKQASASAGVVGTLVSSEVPTGTVNGTNKIFTLSATPITGAVSFVVTAPNQPSQILQLGFDFTMNGVTATLVNAPITSSTIYAIYYK